MHLTRGKVLYILLVIWQTLQSVVVVGQFDYKVYGISRGKYNLNSDILKAGFVIRKEGFFRYAYEATTAAPSQNDHFLDVDKMKKYYKRDIPPPAKPVDTDFQLLEWPGRTSVEQKKQVEESLKTNQKYCKKGPTKKLKCTVWMLKFERDNGKISHYPCNAQEGTRIVALGGIQTPDDDSNSTANASTSGSGPNPGSIEESKSFQKVWLSHGTKSIYTRYIQPMFIPETILLEMAKDEATDPDDYCSGVAPTSPTEPHFLDLRTVHDFTFTRGRLILAMKCGIVVVSGLTHDFLLYKVATLRGERRMGKNLFPDPINKIGSSVCCALYAHDCSLDQAIVAAYSYVPGRSWDEKKYIYTSFDLGDTFLKKIIAEQISALNLVVGLYKYYMEQWHDYYEYLNNPDQDDLNNDDPFISNLRKKEMWDSSTTEGKEKMFGVGVTIQERRSSSLRKVAEILRNQVWTRKQRLAGNAKKDLTPRWVQAIVNKSREEAGWDLDQWTDANCNQIPDCANNFKDDEAADWLLGEVNVTVKTPRVVANDRNMSCRAITSIIILPEEKQVMALCRVAIGNGTIVTVVGGPNPGPTSSPSSVAFGQDDTYGFFAFFKFNIETAIPVTYLIPVSQRVFYCKFIIDDRDPNNPKVVQPILIRVAGSVTVFVTNCEGMVYMSTNFGSTLFNAAFYYDKAIIDDYCLKPNSTNTSTAPMPSTTPNPWCLSKTFFGAFLCNQMKNRVRNRPTVNPSQLGVWKVNNSGGYIEKNKTVEMCDDRPDEKPTHVRSFYLCALDVPPIVTADQSGSVLVITFGRFFARGAIAYNRETRFIVGETLDELDHKRRFENIVFPGLNTNGEAILAISLAQYYSIPDTDFRNVLYKGRNAIRLVQMPIELYQDLRQYHSSNAAVCGNAVTNGYTLPSCQTISFSVHPKQLTMDIGETKVVSVRVKDENPYLPLWIFSSNGNTVEVNAYYNHHKDGTVVDVDDLSSHNWDVEIKVRGNSKNEKLGEHLTNAFYGSEYAKIHDYSSLISLVNTPNIRCHVQPTATVSVNVGCHGKRLVAHEDDHRPQCHQFRQHFNYTIKKGQFDPDLANYWITKESEQARPYFKVMSNGDLSVTYDYATWGCPIEPYPSENFIPDLRIVKPGQKSEDGERFDGKFVLIEIFGAKGYSYKYKLKDIEAYKKCKRKPQTLKDLTEEWKHRQRFFHMAYERLVFPNNNAILATVNWLTDVRGNQIFYNEDVKEHINIWNRANYMNCTDYENPALDLGVTDEEMMEDFEIMESLRPEIKDEDLHQDVYAVKETDDGTLVEDEEGLEEEEEDEDERDPLFLESPNEVVWSQLDRQRVYMFLAVAVDKDHSLCNYHTLFGVSLRGGATDINDLISFLIFFLFVIFWVLLMIGGFYIRKRYLRVSYINHARVKKLEEAAWNVVYRYEKMIHDMELGRILRTEEEPGVKDKQAKKKK